MADSRRDRRPFRIGLFGLVAVVALLLGLPGIGLASARPIVRVGGGPVAEDQAHSCACGMGCRPGECCCEKRGVEPGRPDPHRPSKAPAPRGATPCLASAPCGQPGAPAPTPAWRGGKAAAMATIPILLAPMAGAPLEPAGPGPVPAPFLDPLDEPPRPTASS